MRGSINKVCESSECGGKTHGRAVQSHDQDLWVRVEGMCDVQILSHEALKIVTLDIYVFGW